MLTRVFLTLWSRRRSRCGFPSEVTIAHVTLTTAEKHILVWSLTLFYTPWLIVAFHVVEETSLERRPIKLRLQDSLMKIIWNLGVFEEYHSKFQ